jgi:hypothetical protein
MFVMNLQSVANGVYIRTHNRRLSSLRAALTISQSIRSWYGTIPASPSAMTCTSYKISFAAVGLLAEMSQGYVWIPILVARRSIFVCSSHGTPTPDVDAPSLVTCWASRNDIFDLMALSLLKRRRRWDSECLITISR